jgi:hypothetical protein
MAILLNDVFVVFGRIIQGVEVRVNFLIYFTAAEAPCPPTLMPH